MLDDDNKNCLFVEIDKLVRPQNLYLDLLFPFLSFVFGFFLLLRGFVFLTFLANWWLPS